MNYNEGPKKKMKDASEHIKEIEKKYINFKYLYKHRQKGSVDEQREPVFETKDVDLNEKVRNEFMEEIIVRIKAILQQYDFEPNFDFKKDLERGQIGVVEDNNFPTTLKRVMEIIANPTDSANRSDKKKDSISPFSVGVSVSMYSCFIFIVFK